MDEDFFFFLSMSRITGNFLLIKIIKFRKSISFVLNIVRLNSLGLINRFFFLNYDREKDKFIYRSDSMILIHKSVDFLWHKIICIVNTESFVPQKIN